MALYKYKALSQSGAPVEGVIEARDATDAVIKLKETCSVIDDLKPVNAKASILSKNVSIKINEKNLSLVCKQFAIILTAGLPIVRTVELIAGQTEDKVIKNILIEVAEDVSSGYGLADSFEKRGPKLPVTFIETVRAGEETGRLDIAFQRLHDYLTKKTRVKAKVVSALTYPMFVLGVAIIVIIIIMGFAVPVFIETFESLETRLPLPTRALIGLSNFTQAYGLIILIIIAIIVVALIVFGRTEKGAYTLSRIVLKLPIIGKVQYMNAASQFANTLSTMLDAGLPVMKAMNITGRSMTNRFMGQSVIDCVEGVEQGYSMGACLKANGTLPELLIEMVSVGEEAGSLPETLAVIGEYYDNEVETVTTRAVSLLEPIIICVLAVFVLWVLLSVYLPMFSMYDNFNGQL